MKPIQVGLLGIGTVGGGVFTVLRRNGEEIARRAGCDIAIKVVADKDVEKARRLDRTSRLTAIACQQALGDRRGEAKDVLEGLVAYMTGKKGYYDALQSVHVARATLLYATGTTGVSDAK